MKKILPLLLLTVCFVFLQQSYTKADWKFDPKLRFSNNTNHSKDKFERDYKRAMKDHNATQSILGASVDFQIGYGATNPNINEQSGAENVSTQSKGGFTFGALLNLSLFDAFKITTGLDFTKKNFEVGLPYDVPSSGTGDSVIKSLNNSYINIPLNLNVGGMISESVGLSFSGGPYFGFLLNDNPDISGYKSFDLGLNGILTANYLLNSFTSIILGTDVQYGGLNNLLSNSNIESAHTLNWTAFTGLRIGFDL
ncbi:MAG TPA: outer membrane beta-barrel protein [Ignavibacteria bacterium]|nr:outer membrane beta-barrel protein [Ignavibacteria bacterium]